MLITSLLDMKNFETNTVIQVPVPIVFNSLTNQINAWWTEMFEGSAEKVGDVFTVRFGSQIYKTLKVEELIPNESLTWRVIDSIIDLPELNNKSEWVDTRIIWTLSNTTTGTEVQLTHIGLTPEIECYDLCKNGWQSFLYSLNKYLITGIGAPFKLIDTE